MRLAGRPAQQPHTARYQAPVTIHYRFHPRAGQRVEVTRRHRFRGTEVLVVRQPDGTLAQIPMWMCSPGAATLAVVDRPRVALDALRDLRLVLDAVLPLCSHTDVGERHGTSEDLLALLEPVPAPTPAMRETLVPMLATLLLEALGARTPYPETAEREVRNEQDRG